MSKQFIVVYKLNILTLHIVISYRMVSQTSYIELILHKYESSHMIGRFDH